VKLVIPIAVLILFSCSEEISRKETILCTLPPSAYHSYLYTAHEIAQDPVIDGAPLEKSWQLVRWNPHYADSNFNYKILWSDNKFFVLVKIPIENVKKALKELSGISVFYSDSLLYCRPVSLLKSNAGYDYKTKEEGPFTFAEIRIRDVVNKDSSLLDNPHVSIKFSCREKEEERIRLVFVR
jgi:hypothetical protein